MLSLKVIFARLQSSTASTKAVAAISYARVLASISFGIFIKSLLKIEAISVNESFSAITAKALQESASVEDSQTMISGKSFVEVVSFDETGVIFNQGYCSFDYFASDYVGDVRLL